MSERDDDRFRPRVAPPRSKRSGQSQRFVSRVLRSASKSGPLRKTDTPGRKSGARLGRGHVAAAFAGRGLGALSRRVVVKARLVVLKAAGSRSTSTHLRYIERDGVTKDDEPGKAYDLTHDEADTQSFEERGRGDRHQFRFIVAPEDAEQLEDLRAFTRNLMGRMEADLGTRLEWVAVDHWDTDNPHTHVILRGKNDVGGDLIIARDYISHGMRHRASELASEWLGPRTELEMRQGLLREVEQERWTGLDQSLQGIAENGLVAIAMLPNDRNRSSLIGRLQKLSSMGLVEVDSPESWRLRADLETTLRAMGERGDVVRTMQRALRGQWRDLAITDTNRIAAPITGRIVGKGLADELADRTYLIVDGVDGRAHYVPLSPSHDLADFPLGGIAEVRSNAGGRSMDRMIVARARGGMYLASEHLAHLRTHPDVRRDPDGTVTAHVRRLEALRRVGLVERVSEGVWRIPDDLKSRAQAHDRTLHGGVSVALRSHLPLERQVRAMGATWLDSQLCSPSVVIEGRGFGSEVHTALAQRNRFLVEEGLAQQLGARVVPRRDLLATLRTRDLEIAAKAIESESGLAYRQVINGQRIAGIYRRSILMASGRFAMLVNGVGFSLVPWRPVIESKLGQQVSGFIRGSDVSWTLSRDRGI